MGYEISYGPKRSGRQKGFRWLPAAAAFILALLLGLRLLWPEGTDRVRQLFLPAASGTQAAFRELVENIQSGEKLGDAVTAFCQEIVDNAELPDES